MTKMNNKGQVLVAFILMIPIILMLTICIVDVGLQSIEIRRIDNTVRNSVKYGIKNLDKENAEATMKSLIMDNLKNIDDAIITVDIDNNYAKATVTVKYKGLINITNKTIKIGYYASIKDGKIEINKER